MKIIALLPFKNEEWILPTYISAIKNIADMIIAIDDGSSDNSRKILEEAGATVYANTDKVLGYFKEHTVREKLLMLGRQNHGTHFICLDADEVFTANLYTSLKLYMGKMVPGQKIYMPWIPLWKSNLVYRNDTRGMFHASPKDFIFCDDKTSHYSYMFIGVHRTPQSQNLIQDTSLTLADGGVLHFQFTNWRNNEFKQAWYRCSELLDGKRSAKKINLTYAYLLNSQEVVTYPVPKKWVDNITLPNMHQNSGNWHFEEIMKLFDMHGITFFEPLQIWHIEDLKNEFLKRTGRMPHPDTFSSYIIILNSLKNRIRQIFNDTLLK